MQAGSQWGNGSQVEPTCEERLAQYQLTCAEAAWKPLYVSCCRWLLAPLASYWINWRAPSGEALVWGPDAVLSLLLAVLSATPIWWLCRPSSKVATQVQVRSVEFAFRVSYVDTLAY